MTISLRRSHELGDMGGHHPELLRSSDGTAYTSPGASQPLVRLRGIASQTFVVDG